MAAPSTTAPLVVVASTVQSLLATTRKVQCVLAGLCEAEKGSRLATTSSVSAAAAAASRCDACLLRLAATHAHLQQLAKRILLDLAAGARSTAVQTTVRSSTTAGIQAAAKCLLGAVASTRSILLAVSAANASTATSNARVQPLLVQLRPVMQALKPHKEEAAMSGAPSVQVTAEVIGSVGSSISHSGTTSTTVVVVVVGVRNACSRSTLRVDRCEYTLAWVPSGDHQPTDPSPESASKLVPGVGVGVALPVHITKRVDVSLRRSTGATLGGLVSRD